jgi:hypothetical protein
VSRLNFIKNRHYGETCVLVANGPSLNQMNLSFLRQYTCIGLNKIFLGFKKFKFYPKYHVTVNPTVVEQSQEQLKELTSVKFIGDRGLTDNVSLEENALTYFLNTKQPKHRFCKNLNDGCREGGTVTYAALQIAYHLGFKKVIIIGMDHNFTYDGKPNEARVMQGADSNHFIDNYFGYGQKWDNPDLEKSEESYRIARQVFEDDGREIIDATLGGKCTIFEKANYRTLFNL